jgi:hypothetical protein
MILTKEKALIFRITHISNLPWIFDHGVHCRSSEAQDPDFRQIGNPELIQKRERHLVPIPPGGVLSDYVSFYFTPLAPMLFNIKTGFKEMIQIPMQEIAILVSSVPRLVARRIAFVLSDRHAYLDSAQFADDATGLDRIDWGILQARDFQRDDEDPRKFERYQAEALVHWHLPLDGLLGITLHGERERARLQNELTRRGLSLKLVTKPEWYF